MAYLSTGSKSDSTSEPLPSRDKDERAIEKVSCSFLFSTYLTLPLPTSPLFHLAPTFLHLTSYILHLFLFSPHPFPHLATIPLFPASLSPSRYHSRIPFPISLPFLPRIHFFFTAPFLFSAYLTFFFLIFLISPSPLFPSWCS